MIKLEGLDKTFRTAKRNVHVIDHVDLDVPAGSFFTLVGPSGSGKTTTLRVVAGLERHDSGRVTLGDAVVSDPAAGTFVPASERGIGMVFQSYAIWPHMNVFDNVSYPLRQRKSLDRARIGARVEETLELVGLRALAQAPATALSGGQQQRVALARALVDRPKVLLLDEPLSNLDARLRERMRSEIRDIQRSIGITALYVTHDRAEALSMSTLVAVMNDGRIEMVGTPREVYERPQTRFTAEFLGQCNIIAGRIDVLHNAGLATIATAIGPIRSRVSRAFPAGAAVEVILRPEDVVIGPPAGLPHGARRVLRALNYLGDRIECAVDIAGLNIHGIAHPGLESGPGDSVDITILDRGWAIPV